MLFWHAVVYSEVHIRKHIFKMEVLYFFKFKCKKTGEVPGILCGRQASSDIHESADRHYQPIRSLSG